MRPNGGYIGAAPAATLIAAPGVWDMRQQERAARSALWPVVTDDQFYANVSLLIHAEGDGNAVMDSSAFKHTITPYGNATQSTARFRFGSKSLYFDGSGDYFQIADNAAFGFVTGDFTIEYWHYPIQNVGNETVVDLRPSDTGQWLVIGKSSAGALRCYDGLSIRTGGTMTLSAWNHVAWSRVSGTNSLYLNGTRVITFSNSGSVGTSRPVTIGSNVLTSAENVLGYVDELRVTKGVGRYSGTTITVPTAAFTP